MRVDEAQRIAALREIEIYALDGGGLLREIEQVDTTACDGGLVHEPARLAEVLAFGTLGQLREGDGP